MELESFPVAYWSVCVIDSGSTAVSFLCKKWAGLWYKTYKTCFQVWVSTGVHAECPDHITTISLMYLLVSNVFVAFRQVVLGFFWTLCLYAYVINWKVFQLMELYFFDIWLSARTSIALRVTWKKCLSCLDFIFPTRISRSQYKFQD